MIAEEKKFKVVDIIKNKMDLASKDTILSYRAGKETSGVNVEDEILILNKLADDEIIEVINNYSSDYK